MPVSQSSAIEDFAPGAPGISPRWTSSAKSGVGTALSHGSPLWFTLSHGIVNEVYFPRVDSACTRDFGLLVTGPDGYFSEEKRDCHSTTAWLEPGVPAFTVTNLARDARYRIEKQIISDPERPCLIQRITFIPLVGTLADYRLYALLAPHLVNAGMGNSAWLGTQNGADLLYASGRSRYLALGSSASWRSRSVGFVGSSDGYQQLLQGGRLDPQYQRADDGNVAITAEIDLAGRTHVDLVLGFGQSETEAGANVLATLHKGWDASLAGYRRNWRDWQARLNDLDRPASGPVNQYRVSTAILASHRAVDRPGAVVASLSIPWGASKGDDDMGGYHLVWPRDLVETAGGFLAAGDRTEALHILDYLREVQLASGRWAQNMWLDGRPYWRGVQMDECAFPILLVDLLRRNGVLEGAAFTPYLPMVRSAARYIVTHGPASRQDRWEENAGYSPFTLAVEIAALLAAADLLDDANAAQHLRETADCWNEQIEHWTYVSDPDPNLGVRGYYVRMGNDLPTDIADAATGMTPIRNQVADRSSMPTRHILSPDTLALVRFGLRAADDPRIVDTVRMIDATLKVELPQGALWYRYTGDGYGEHEDGSAFDGTGRGRAWPLLAAERAHYELLAGHRPIAEALLRSFEASAGDEGLIPEQSWDADDVPERELFRGRPSGSAMPLVWAHAEHIKLLRSLADGAVFDMPPQTHERYVAGTAPSPIRIWRVNDAITHIPAGKTLRLELEAPARVHWGIDGWRSAADLETRESGIGTHIADLDTAALQPGSHVNFTFFWPADNRWDASRFDVQVIGQ